MKNSPQSAVVFGSMRVPFLALPTTCVAIGAATAFHEGARISLVNLVLALAGAVAAHIAVNALNEYDDFRSGLDFKTPATPFSGGSKTLPSHPRQARLALVTGLGGVVVTILLGVYFAWRVGMMILPLGVLGVAIIAAYTAWITRKPLLCLLAPGIGFGTLMVMGTHFVLAGSYSWGAFVASLSPAFLVSDLLLINQLPDTEADRSVGRKHLPIVMGRRGAARLYGVLLAGAYGSIVAGCLAGILPRLALIALVTAVLAVPTAVGAVRHCDSVEGLVPYLGMNVVLILLTNLLLAVGIFLG